MKERWAVCMPEASPKALAALRGRAKVRVARVGDDLWVFCPEADEALRHLLCRLPGGRRFQVAEDDQLIPAGARVPSGRLPATRWQELADWLEVELPRAGLPGICSGWVPLTVVRGGPVREPNVLLVSSDSLRCYAESAPEFRLRHCCFAADETGRCVVWGDPVPPLRGRAYVERDGVAVPAGFTWSPALDSPVAREALRLSPGDLALLHASGEWERVPASCFVRARRSAIRCSTGETHP